MGVVKIYVAVVEALNKKERGDETQFTTKIVGETSLGSSYSQLRVDGLLLPKLDVLAP
jgi:hypothetical protein